MKVKNHIIASILVFIFAFLISLFSIISYASYKISQEIKAQNKTIIDDVASIKEAIVNPAYIQKQDDIYDLLDTKYSDIEDKIENVTIEVVVEQE